MGWYLPVTVFVQRRVGVMFSGVMLLPSIKTFLGWKWATFPICGAQADVLSKCAAMYTVKSSCICQSLLSNDRIFDFLVFDCLIHLYSNQPITLKCLVSEWYGTPKGDAVIYVRVAPVTNWLLGHIPKTHVPPWYTSVIKYNYGYRNLKIQLTVSIQVIANLHHLKKKSWGKEGILGQNDKYLSQVYTVW